MLSYYKQDKNKVNSIYIGNFDFPEGLPFGELISAKFNSEIIDTNQVSPAKFLIDSGSSVILCPFNIYSQWGFTKDQLQEATNPCVQGSTGQENIIMGTITLPFFIKAMDGFYRTKQYEVMVNKPNESLDFLIIGGKLWKDSNLKLEVSMSYMKDSSDLINRFGQQQNCQLFLFNNIQPKVKCREIKK